MDIRMRRCIGDLKKTTLNLLQWVKLHQSKLLLECILDVKTLPAGAGENFWKLIQVGR